MTKVLILDQSKSVRNILRERLEYEGFSAEAVENEAAASALCERIPFDVILSDTECKVPDAGIPFIALSADTSIDTAVKAVRNGAQDFLTKPIDMNRLLQSLHRTIDNPAPAQAPPAAPPVRRRRAHSAQLLPSRYRSRRARRVMESETLSIHCRTVSRSSWHSASMACSRSRAASSASRPNRQPTP